MQVESLDSPTAAERFYEERYRHGYMDVWDRDRHRRLRDVLRTIDLPVGARVLDFGCGSGALTALLVDVWPHAEVHGADISSTAVASARRRVPGARFHVLDAAFVNGGQGQFDFVFSHHVLEHVFQLSGTVRDLVRLMAAGGRSLHVMPCGNAGSLAHWLCEQRPDGIDPEHGNRFFFEESSHLRRLRSADLAATFAAHGGRVVEAAYGYHRFGVLRLMTEMTPPNWFAMLDPRRCHRRSLPLLLSLLLLVAALAALRAPIQVLLRARRAVRQVFVYRTRGLARPGTLLLFALAVPALLCAPLVLPVEIAVRGLDRREWRRSQSDPRGSEMFVQIAAAAAAHERAGAAVGAPAAANRATAAMAGAPGD